MKDHGWVRTRPNRSEREADRSGDGVDAAAHPLHELQRSAGNLATTAYVQARLRVGAVDDPAERAADRVADRVVDATRGERLTATDVLHRIEPHVGGDLSGVRVHTDARAHELADGIGARAFTHRKDIYFARGEYRPDTTDGVRTIAHEAAHVAQQASLPAGEVAPIRRLRNPFRKLGKNINRALGRTNVVGTEDIKEQKSGGGGTANRVDKVTMKKHAMDGESKKGFFKPRTEFAKAENAVGSSRLARGMGMKDVIARNKFARINGELGAVSAMAKGEQVRGSLFDEPVPRQGRTDEQMRELAEMSNWTQKEDGEWYKFSGLEMNDVDFSRPETQKGLNDLQWFDAISGQHDRHGGNIFIDPDTGKVMGIDDDMSLGDGLKSEDLEEGWSKFSGLPSRIDVDTASKILALKPEDIPKLLTRSGDPKKIPKKAIEETKARLKKVQEHIEKLGLDGQIYQWNQAVYDETLQEEDRGHGSHRHAPSYTKKLQGELDKARKGEDGYRLKGGGVPKDDLKIPETMPPLPPVPDRTNRPSLSKTPPPVPDRSLKPKLQPRKPKDRNESLDVLAKGGLEIKDLGI